MDDRVKDLLLKIQQGQVCTSMNTTGGRTEILSFFTLFGL